ncbi:Nucleolar protein 58, variant 2 [Cymbomonas tetramitiformis]|uniref:Nucleolar protein 58, variant 2 n=1 Tax=Cymbomonas tetramitiformis TaxID=36881 RepID=A0AAE0C438_9CHLO|nr:Nucleolar protein 58, variant 2 [Cymbomonas tetramitiformis]|eukprot:gene9992-11826_t
MLLLFESPAGFALFKVLNEKKLKSSSVEDLAADFLDTESAKKTLKLKAFTKFEDTAEALAAAAALVDSKLDKKLKKFLKKNATTDETIAVADSKLGSIIKEKLEIPCVHSAGVMELLRGARTHMEELAEGLSAAEVAPMALGLSHSLSRYKLKFSPDKVDTMIVQAIGLLDDLDKELNTYAMRVREWYGWHFPELTKIIADNIDYAKCVKFMGLRVNAADLDFSAILGEEVEQELKDAAVVSMGTDVTDEDMDYVKSLAQEVIALSEYRGQLSDYLRNRMQAIAPNLTVLVGELVGARLIAHAGSLMSLAKHPASTVQILGAEKALFRALKTKHETPKYGLIYHASLIGQAAPKHKGKISRVLASKCALSIRVDALGDETDATIGVEARAKVEARLRQLEGRSLATSSGKAKGTPKVESYDNKPKGQAIASAAKAYNADADVTMAEEAPKKKEKKQAAAEEEEEEKPKKKKKKDKAGDEGEEEPKKKKKEKKRKAEEEEEEAEAPVKEKKKKKKKAEE